VSRMLDIAPACDLAVAAAMSAGATAAEAYASDERGTEVRVFEDKVESLHTSAARGIGIRTWLDGRCGYAYGTDLTEAGLADLASRSAAATAASDPDEWARAPEESGQSDVPGLYDEALAAWSTERKIDLARAIERAARTDSRVSAVEQTVFADEEVEVWLANSAGFSAGYRASSCYAFLQVFAGEGAELQTGLGLGMGREPGQIDAEAVGAEGAERAVSLVGARQPSSRTCPVLLDPFVAASFAGLIGSTLSAEAVQRGRSLFAGRVGQEVAAPDLELVDDGLDPDGFGSAPFDGEGTPSGRTALLAGGVLKSYLYDVYTARRDETSSTGNAGRGGYGSPPSVSATNLVVSPGDETFEGLVSKAGDGIYITDVAGLHSGVNPVSGVFSVGASGRLIENGELGTPVREVTVASDLVSMLKSVIAIGEEPRWVPFGGSVKTPAILIGEMTVSGS
jgi:PmbA protein